MISGSSGYSVNMTFDQHLGFPGTNTVFEGVVERVGRPKYVNNRGFELVYAPVQVRVLRWFRGPRPASAHVTLRALGGTANGVEFRGELVAGEAMKKRGTRMLVFATTPLVTYGDTIAATTPNAVFVRDGDELAEVTTRDPGAPVVTRVSVAYARNVLGAPVL